MIFNSDNEKHLEANCLRCIHLSICHANTLLEDVDHALNYSGTANKDEVLAWICRFYDKEVI